MVWPRTRSAPTSGPAGPPIAPAVDSLRRSPDPGAAGPAARPAAGPGSDRRPSSPRPDRWRRAGRCHRAVGPGLPQDHLGPGWQLGRARRVGCGHLQCPPPDHDPARKGQDVGMTSRVAVTGAAGKLGRAVVSDLREQGWEVLAIDRVRPAGTEGEFVTVDLTDAGQVLEVLTGWVDEHRRRWTRWSIWLRCRPPAAAELGHFRQQRHRDLERLQRRPQRRCPQPGLGLQRDRSRPAVRHPAAVPARGRGVRAAPGEHLLHGEGPGGGDGRTFLPLGPGTEK